MFRGQIRAWESGRSRLSVLLACPRAKPERPPDPGPRPGSGGRSVHPHARGERQVVQNLKIAQNGSSPRPWGTLVRAARGMGLNRFIPTPVGNAAKPPPWEGSGAVHPHARGERAFRLLLIESRPGSSPRPWGTPQAAQVASSNPRFIPTPVGNADRQTEADTLATGSSPRPWGTPTRRCRAAGGSRFIPTPVGNAFALGARTVKPAVHPHARGERHCRFHLAHAANGSSPRPWGTRAISFCAEQSRRFIPTPVGNATPHAPTAGHLAVHPHARGERLVRVGAVAAGAGSSPRPWGTPQPP